MIDQELDTRPDSELSDMELNSKILLANETTRMIGKHLWEQDRTHKRQEITKTIGHEVSVADDRVNFWAMMDRWNPFKAEVKGKRIKVTKKKGPDRTIEE